MYARNLCWTTLALVVGAHSLAAQSVADSTMSAVAPDSVGSRTPDTSSTESFDQPASQPAMVVEVSSALAPPVDTVIARACTAAEPGSVAPGLVRVVFRGQATEADRAYAAQRVGGTLAKAGDGSEAYTLLLSDGNPIRVAASRLMRLRSVSGVSEISCPG